MDCAGEIVLVKLFFMNSGYKFTGLIANNIKSISLIDFGYLTCSDSGQKIGKDFPVQKIRRYDYQDV